MIVKGLGAHCWLMLRYGLWEASVLSCTGPHQNASSPAHVTVSDPPSRKSVSCVLSRWHSVAEEGFLFVKRHGRGQFQLAAINARTSFNRASFIEAGRILLTLKHSFNFAS